MVLYYCNKTVNLIYDRKEDAGDDYYILKFNDDLSELTILDEDNNVVTDLDREFIHILCDLGQYYPFEEMHINYEEALNALCTDQLYELRFRRQYASIYSHSFRNGKKIDFQDIIDEWNNEKLDNGK